MKSLLGLILICLWGAWCGFEIPDFIEAMVSSGIGGFLIASFVFSLE